MELNKNHLERKKKRMAVMTAKCKQAFVVADNKTKEFNNKTKNVKATTKNQILIEKISKQIKMDVNK